MPEDILDATADSSPAPSTPTLDVEAPADPAVSQTSDDAQTSAPSGTETPTSSTSDATVSPTKAAIDFLTKPPEGEDAKPEAPKAPDNRQKDSKSSKPTEAKPDPAKPEAPLPEDENPLGDFSPEEQKRLSGKTRQRIETLHHKWKDTEKKYETDRPYIDTGKAFAGIVKQYGIERDLGDVKNDADVAAVIRSQAAINRLMGGTGTRDDAVWVAKTCAYFDKVRSHFGIPGGASTPSVDTEALAAAVAKAESDFDFEPLKALLSKAKPVQQERTPAPVPAPPPAQPVQQTQQTQQVDPNINVYSDMLSNQLAEDGVKSPAEYMESKLWPKIATQLATKFPGQNPTAVYDQLSPVARYNVALMAHQDIRKQEKALAPQPPPRPASQPRPVRGSGTAPAATNLTPTAAAIQFLSQG